MTLSLSLPRALSLQASPSHLFIEAGRLSFFATLQRHPEGSPLAELSKHARGTGCRLILGPLLIEASML